MQSAAPLYLFAKAPVAGKVKTRLESHCSPERAAHIAEHLIVETIIQTRAHWPGEVILSVGGDIRHPSIIKIANETGVVVLAQHSGSLGERMHRTFVDESRPTAILGCDAPHILAKDLKATAAYLRKGENVIGPSLDGGYYLIALQCAHSELFRGIKWGSNTVLATTMQRAQKLDLKFEHLATLQDIDTWPDLLTAAESNTRLRHLIEQFVVTN